MISDFARIERSAVISIGFHAALFGSYFALKHQKQEQNVVLTKVDFIDLKPEEAVPAAPAPAMQAPPKSLTDLIRMALPVFNRPKPPEPVMPKDMPLDKIKPQLKDVSMPKLDLDKKMASSKEKPLDLKLDRLPQDRQIADMAASRQPKVSDLATMKEESKISLDAVGRVAVPEEPHIRINPGRAYNPSMADMPTAKVSPTAAAEPPSAPALNLSRQLSARSSPSLPIGYSRGHAISLATAPRPAAAPIKIPSAPKAAAEEKLAKAEGKPKAVEISGPLAKRKILSSYLPAYPEWARAQGVEADVVLRFFVGPDGYVLDKMSVERTSGYPKLDKLCEEAIKKWVFAPLPGSEEAQWGFVTFRFRLK